MISSQTNIKNVPLSLKKKLQTLAINILQIINKYAESQNKLSEDRKTNIRHLRSLLEVASVNPAESNYKTPDIMAAEIADYLNNRELFITGWFNGSTLRAGIFEIFKRDYPLALCRGEPDKKHYRQLAADLEKMNHLLQESMTRLLSYKNAILSSKATLTKVNDSIDKLNVVPKIDLSSPKKDLHDALHLQINEIGELETRLKEEERIQEELEQSIIIKSDAIIRLQRLLKIAKDNEEKVKAENQRLRSGMSQTLFAQSSRRACGQEHKRSRVSTIAMTEFKR